MMQIRAHGSSQIYHDIQRFLPIESEPRLQPAKLHTDMIIAASTNTIANPNVAFTRNRPQIHQSSSEGVHGFGVPLGICPMQPCLTLQHEPSAPISQVQSGHRGLSCSFDSLFECCEKGRVWPKNLIVGTKPCKTSLDRTLRPR